MLSVYMCLIFFVLLFLIYFWSQRRMKQEEIADVEGVMESLKTTNQDEDVWNISARVNQQTTGPGANQGSNWPTHDTHIPIDNFVLTHDYTMKDNRPPPPPYSEVGLPSYEQATGCRPPKPDLPTVHESSAASQRNNPGPSS